MREVYSSLAHSIRHYGAVQDGSRDWDGGCRGVSAVRGGWEVVKREGEGGVRVRLLIILGVGLIGSQDLSGVRRMRYVGASHGMCRVFPLLREWSFSLK
jgi:hypothetical protein